MTASALAATAVTGIATAAAAAGPAAGATHAAHAAHTGPLKAASDTYSTGATGTLAVTSRHGVLANDSGGDLQLVSHTAPGHGSLTLNPDGSFNYVPQAGFTGDDTFTYTVTNAVHLYSTHLPPLGNFGGVNVTAGGYGSSLYPDPGHPGLFYGLTDRGPNVTAADGNDVEPIPTFDPSIGLSKFEGGHAVLERRIPLRDGSGHPYTGLVNSQNPTGEVIEDLDGHSLAQDPNGYDSEGLVALPDGTFWVSDEYGPFITHFSRDGRALQRLSPLDGSLPKELVNRVPNRGMEGLTITPDGKTLVGMMQSALQQTDLNGKNAKNVVPVRIVTYGLRTHALHEYLYLLHDPKTTGTAVSEITALSNRTFLVDERDGNFPGAGVFKQLWKIDLSQATDVGPAAKVPGATYDAAHGGLLIGGPGGKTIEELTQGEDTADASTTLTGAGISPVTETLGLDVNGLLLSLDPKATFFDHDKVEGVATLDGGKQLVISNDSDLGIAGVTNTAAPWQLEAKIDPATGQQDDGEYLSIDMTKVAASGATTTSTATVTIHVTG
jgi:hypothetical protein